MYRTGKQLTGEGKGIYSRRALDILMIQIRKLKLKNEQLKLIIKKEENNQLKDKNHETKRQI